jgi:hypothetical protein
VYLENLMGMGLYFVESSSYPTHEQPLPAAVLSNNLDTETKTSDCTPKEIYVEIIKMSSPQNITPYPSKLPVLAKLRA